MSASQTEEFRRRGEELRAAVGPATGRREVGLAKLGLRSAQEVLRASVEALPGRILAVRSRSNGPDDPDPGR